MYCPGFNSELSLCDRIGHPSSSRNSRSRRLYCAAPSAAAWISCDSITRPMFANRNLRIFSLDPIFFIDTPATPLSTVRNTLFQEFPLNRPSRTLRWILPLKCACDSEPDCGCNRRGEGVSNLPIGRSLPPAELPEVGEPLNPSHHPNGQPGMSFHGKIRSRGLVRNSQAIHAQFPPLFPGSRRSQIRTAVFFRSSDNRGRDGLGIGHPAASPFPSSGRHQVLKSIPTVRCLLSGSGQLKYDILFSGRATRMKRGRNCGTP